MWICLLFALLAPVEVIAASSDTCNNLAAQAEKKKARIPGYSSGRRVVGTGRAQFYIAPSEFCPMKGVFVLFQTTKFKRMPMSGNSQKFRTGALKGTTFRDGC